MLGFTAARAFLLQRAGGRGGRHTPAALCRLPFAAAPPVAERRRWGAQASAAAAKGSGVAVLGSSPARHAGLGALRP